MGSKELDNPKQNQLRETVFHYLWIWFDFLSNYLQVATEKLDLAQCTWREPPLVSQFNFMNTNL